MKKSTIIRLIVNIVYAIGVAAVIVLGCTCLWGSNEVQYPDAMLPSTYRENAFTLLVFGSIPMLAASIAVYYVNNLDEGPHKKRNALLVFLPAIISGACLLFIVGLLLIGPIIYSYQIQ